MIIIVFAFKSLAEYLIRNVNYEVERPDSCPRRSCRRRHCFWKHTGYTRHAHDGGEPVLLRIQRFRCRYCHLVVSCLFSFLVSYRRYSAQIVAGCTEIYATAPAMAQGRSRTLLPDFGGRTYSRSAGNNSGARCCKEGVRDIR